MAHASDDPNDKALWITLAQSWVRLAEHAAHISASGDIAAKAGRAAVKDALALQPAVFDFQSCLERPARGGKAPPGRALRTP
jgi:hypothetical protein